MFEKLDPMSPGAGIGLAMIQRIVEKCGGKVWVESEGSDKGSSFFFTLPHAVVQG
jgi:signal transduction histidine kinase